MASWKRFFFHNWHLKLFSLLLASMLWITIARESTSEVAIEVPLEYQNVPPNTEVISETTNAVEVRLRGPATLIKEISARDISTTIDLAGSAQGESKVFPLTTRHVRAPFGIEVIGVIPARVHVALEQHISAQLRIAPTISGKPAPGFEVSKILVTPESIRVEGPASHVRSLKEATTTPVDLSGKRATVRQAVDLDVADSLVRVPQTESVVVEVQIRPGKL
jgi:YbbR domain-containing protein